MSPSNKKLLWILTGSIAAFKACQAISKLVQAGYDIKVIATEDALKFVGAATLEGLTGKKISTSLYEQGSMMEHISLERWADIILMAPATANTINRLASGSASDLIGTLFLAHEFTKPFLIAPAMNVAMYKHPVTQKSLQTLKDIGIQFVDSGAGMLACGEVGQGRLAEVTEIIAAVNAAADELDTQKSGTAIGNDPKSSVIENSKSAGTSKPSLIKAGRAFKVLITAGGTSEAIDGVRAITNFSSGKTGAALAENFFHAGVDVTLLLAEHSTAITELSAKKFTDSKSLKSLIQNEVSNSDYDLVIHAAAVSDYVVSETQSSAGKSKDSSKEKISSESDFLQLTLVKNEKILPLIKGFSKNKDLKVVAFKLTYTQDLSLQKEKAKKLLFAGADLVVQNDFNQIQNGIHQYRVFDSEVETQIQGKESLAEFLIQKYLLEYLNGGRK